MSGSGTNRLVQSENAKNGESQSALTSALMNANEVALKINGKKKGKKK